ncbi:DegT/DnrJ/EryC1/StrS family aminotransferase [Dactylosporangium salmoneum]|uniref:DegT/DnrJ/EryC1/StrS family aminotransferase n=1 Tax=Dactylosporangium salmoneum TaxID=53361 RepID=A0ABN3FLX8_9ACTN
MTTDLRYDAAHPVDDRYTPPPDRELDAFAAVLGDGRLSGGAPILAEYEQALATWFRVTRAIAVSSGSAALHAALVAVGVGPDDEVLVPATAPIATAMPILTCHATPVIVDTVPGSLALDPQDIARKLTSRTRAALTLPMWGYPADDTAAAILAAAGVPIIEDACQAHGTRVRGRYAGTQHRIGCFSTHDRKLLPTGEGGFILTNDEELADRIDYYTHLDHLRGDAHGVNYKLAAPLAMIGHRRLGQLNDQLTARRRNAARLLSVLPPDGRLRELGYGSDDAPNYYALVLTSAPQHATGIAEALTAAGLPLDSVRFGYGPLYRRPLFATYATPCPNAQQLTTTTFHLPVHPAMTDQTLGWVADRIRNLAEGQRS